MATTIKPKRIDTDMVTTGPIQPLPRATWWKGPRQHRQGTYCLGMWLLRSAKNSDDDGLTFDAKARRMFAVVAEAVQDVYPERTSRHLINKGVVAPCFNDHSDTTYADVCKILDEANRRLA